MILLGFVSLFSQFAMALTPDQRVEEALLMPSKNRSAFFRQADFPVKSTLKDLAWSTKKSMATRWRAFMSLTERSSFDELRALLAQAQSSDVWYMRNAALVATARLPIKERFSILKKGLNDQALVVQASAIRFLGDLGDPRAVTLLLQKQQDLQQQSAIELKLLESEIRTSLERLKN